MVNNIFGNRSDINSGDEQAKSSRSDDHVRRDDFRKAYENDRASKKDDKSKNVEDKKEKTSLFDLSKKNKTKSQQPDKSSTSSSKSQAKDLLSSEADDKLEKDLTDYDNEGDNSEDDFNDALTAANNAFLTDNPKKADAAQKMIKNSQINESNAQFNVKSKETKTSSDVSSSKKEKIELKSKMNDQEKADVSATYTQSQSVNLQTEKSQDMSETTNSQTIQELAAKIIDRIQVMRKDDLNNTIITLRQPPILEGATINLISSDHAKKEFNISFANLSPEAKLFLDRQLNENSLSETLERKGIIVHMITTTTQVENLINTESDQNLRDQQERQQDQQQQQQQEEDENQ